MASRAQVAAVVAEKLRDDRSGAVEAAAAWLKDTGRGREASYLARDVAAALAKRGYVYVRVTTARPLEGIARKQVEAFVKAQTGARELELELTVEPALVGGVRIETPTQEIDATVRQGLKKFVEGVSR